MTPLSVMPHGTIRSNCERSVFTFSAKPWLVTQREIRTPMAASFASPTQMPVRPGNAAGRDAERADGPNQDLLEVAHVPMDVAAIGLEIDDRIADELPGAVIRHVAATAGLEQANARRRERLGGRTHVRADRCAS